MKRRKPPAIADAAEEAVNQLSGTTCVEVTLTTHGLSIMRQTPGALLRWLMIAPPPNGV
jgi:hypothetical protein